MRLARSIAMVALLWLTGLTPETRARGLAVKAPAPAANSIELCLAHHHTGHMVLSVTNSGVMGSFSREYTDYFTGEPLTTLEYPVGSGATYLWGGDNWLGGVVGTDTLVSTGADGWAVAGAELHPDGRGMIYRSCLDSTSPGFDGARADQEYEAVYFDTCLSCTRYELDYLDRRLHRPLPVEIVQRSYSWAYPHTDDFVLLDYTVRNLGTDTIHSFYFGQYMDHDVSAPGQDANAAASDDLAGFLARCLSTDCGVELPLNMAWIADNDGELQAIPSERAPDIAGMRVLSLSQGQAVSFNWWQNNGDINLDWGPQARASYRWFGTGGSGVPEGDRNKYHLLSDHEQDYDQFAITAISNSDSIWVPPPEYLEGSLATGTDPRYVLSTGPYELAPGQSIAVALAVVVGENLHTDRLNFQHLPYDPASYAAGLDFSNFIQNGLEAGWVYDNPGVDTDGDGYAGESITCGDSTVWISGDGVPDWRAVVPPPAPELWAEPTGEGILLHWYGLAAETSRDPIRRESDFEGYHVYLSSSQEGSDFVRVASYDRNDYYRYEWSDRLLDWKLSDHLFSFDETICRYAPGGCDDAAWYPDDFTRAAPYIMPNFPDSVFYFVQLGPNASRLGFETPIIRVYPDAPKPSETILANMPEDSAALYLTDEGRFKYYEYQLLLDGLIRDHLYRVAVTAYDRGPLAPDGVGLESALSKNVKMLTPEGPACCTGLRGDVDCDGADEPTMGDIVRLVDFMFISSDSLCCIAEADVNGSGGWLPGEEDITLGDLAILISYLFIDEAPPPNCR